MPVFPSVRTGESLQGARGWFPTALEEAKIRGEHLALQPPYLCQ